jgi:hypothetical protein
MGNLQKATICGDCTNSTEAPTYRRAMQQVKKQLVVIERKVQPALQGRSQSALQATRDVTLIFSRPDKLQKLLASHK